ncbi:ABC transporter permease [Halioglobus maricola]|uniref:ABC transporter permease n=1 Tax=Halioglobus maricola TaxID=2601894 RepID=A0A5P9NQ75_9GAMM|nr:Gldg family protein [Halioglobus maricola]QFU77444.1 ABC transporter permease [Halioglobus maricola]
METRAVARRVAQKEVGLFFTSPVAWLFLGSFAAVCLFVFFWGSSFFARNIADVRPLFQWMPILLVFLCSALTMRMWSEERRTGTLEHVLVQPSALWRFVYGKFRACMLLLVLALVSTVPLPVTVSLIADLDWGPVFAGYLATVLLGALYISVGLFVSSRTDNPIVSLIASVILCGTMFLVGSGIFTEFFSNSTAETLRHFGTGSRFSSITRGVIDARDLFFYLSVTFAFLALNVYTLEREGWARLASTPRQRNWRVGIALLLANLVMANLWVEKMPLPRMDITEGRLYSISQPSRDLLRQLDEPLLIRGYFSDRTHPMLAPLEPQLRDLIREYEAAGIGKVRVEFTDPTLHPEQEREANERYGILPTPFQVADRYQSALMNAYFNVLVQYGSEHVTLSFSDLIEVRTNTSGDPEVLLRNPEFDITRAIRDALYNYRAGGDLFTGIEQPVEFIGYVSDRELLPPKLQAYYDSITAQLQVAIDASDDKFSFRFIDPESRGAVVARQIYDQWGFAPMSTGLDEDSEFYFYLTLADERQVVQLPTGDFNPSDFRTALDSGLKRFARSFTRTVALTTPRIDPQLREYGLGGPSFTNLERAITRDHSIVKEDLSDGMVNPEADILVVAAPQQLDERGVFAIDQFVMRGGTVVLATSPFSVERENGELRLKNWKSGLEPWLQHNGITIRPELVLDEQMGKFPAPVRRGSGDYQFNDVRIINYPFFIDVRRDAIARHAISGSLPQVTMAWVSPLDVERRDRRRVSKILWSSPQAWTDDGTLLMPRSDDKGEIVPPRRPDDQAPASYDLGVALQGRFTSYFTESPSFSDGENLVLRSPESARIVIFPSNDFLSDQVLASQVHASGTQYLGPLELLSNTLDWALQEELLLNIRSRGHFNRTLPPMERKAQVGLEAFNYGAALVWLALLALWHKFRLHRKRKSYAQELGL